MKYEFDRTTVLKISYFSLNTYRKAMTWYSHRVLEFLGYFRGYVISLRSLIQTGNKILSFL